MTEEVRTGPDLPDEGEETPRSLLSWMGETLILIVAAYALAYVLRLFVIQPFYIPTGSMEPTLEPGDQVLVNKFVFRFESPKPGDIVVLHAPPSVGPVDLIKRIVAVGGQTVQARDGHLFVDGRQVPEPYVLVPDFTPFGPVRVPRGMIFLMGDNRTNSRDSRYIGAIPLSSVMGKAFIIYWPLTLNPGQNRFL